MKGIFMKHLGAIVFLFFIFPVVGMNKQNNPRKYYAACREVDVVAARHIRNTMGRIRIFSADKNTAMLTNDISLLTCELGLSKQHVEEKREQVLQEFKNYYEINDEYWKWIRYTTHQLYSLNEKNKSKFYPNQAHDKEVPESATLLLWKELTVRGINPSRVDFSSALRDPFLYGVKVGSKKSVIVVNPLRWNQASAQLKKFACVCAVEELVEELSVLPIVLRYCWTSVVKPEMRQNSNGIKRLREKTRIVSMYSACLRSKETALLMKKYIDNVFNPSITSDDYAFISAVAWRWKVLNKAQQFRVDMKLETIIPRNSFSEPASEENIFEKAEGEDVEDSGYARRPHNSRAESIADANVSEEDSGYDEFID
jgi:hypothetical protein